MNNWNNTEAIWNDYTIEEKGNNNRFILGDENGLFYVAKDNNDLVRIWDVTFGNVIELGSNGIYSLDRTDSGFDLFSGKNEGRELIAWEQFFKSTRSQITSRSTQVISSESNDSFDELIELSRDSFQLDPDES